MRSLNSNGYRLFSLDSRLETHHRQWLHVTLIVTRLHDAEKYVCNNY